MVRTVNVEADQDDAALIRWQARIHQYHEASLSRAEVDAADLPPVAKAAADRPRVGANKRSDAQQARADAADDARIQTRELSLLKRDPAREAARAARSTRRRPAPVRGRRHSVARAGLPHRRGGVAAARCGAAGQAGADVRAHDRARHQPRRARQVRARQHRRLGDVARSREAGGRRARADLGLPRRTGLARHHRRARRRVRAAGLPRVRTSGRARATTNRAALQRLLRQRPQGDRRRPERRQDRPRVRVVELERRHRELALQPARRRDRPAPTTTPRRPRSRTRSSTARCCARGRRCR